MAKYLTKNNMRWTEAPVRGGTVMQKSIIWEGEHDIRSAFFRMPADIQIPQHTHPKWVQVMVLEGQMKVETDDGEELVSAGGCYFIEPGDTHIETAIDDTLVLVTQQEDREEFLKNV